MGGDEVLDKFLELFPVHLLERLTDGHPHRNLVWIPDPVDHQGNGMWAPEDVPWAAAAGHRGHLAPKQMLVRRAEQGEEAFWYHVISYPIVCLDRQQYRKVG